MTDLLLLLIAVVVGIVASGYALDADFRAFKRLVRPRKIAKAPKTDRRVFCKDCKYYKVRDGGGLVPRDEFCAVSVEVVDPVHGISHKSQDPRVLNRRMDCPHHTPHGAERIQLGSSRKA